MDDLVYINLNKGNITFNNEEIEREKLAGDQYVSKAEKIIGKKLKSCINCKNFIFAPKSTNEIQNYEGICTIRDEEVSIFFLCEKFDFKHFKERDMYKDPNCKTLSVE